ncbi:ABC transporter ATP-binding protein [Aureibacter tunicatorum]|uniref:ATP-binding cassette subfamily B protein n=1 Tax=Aureibacter tunicatorum TaxID=866807 RepID=A0AAE3XJ02_9BACT|nr:ABC transporter ATP-binding protein [Aureibacter tunicatorum]MDR6238626.1 ATP-binding cassette subfamily B protein [Aureibacter tunicatorum]BDD05443.1 ABC transporter [Aureibacter tunicatorum]
MKDLKFLNKYFWKYKYRFGLGIFFIIISTYFQILPGQLIRNALNLVVDNITMFKMFEGLNLQTSFEDIIKSSIVLYGFMILGVALLRGFFLFLVRQTIIIMSRHVEYDMKNDIYEHYQQLPTSFFKMNSTGDLMARISEDVSRVRMYIGPAVMYGISLIVLFGMLIPYMFSINTTLTLYALSPLPILSVAIYFVNNQVNKRSEEIQRQLSKLSTFTQEAFSGIRVIKSFSREKNSVENFEQESNEYKDRSLKLTFVQAMFFPLIVGLIGVSTILTIYVGGMEVIEGTLSFGNIAEFVIYVNLLTWPVASLGWVTSIMQRAAASQKRINEFLNVKNDILSEKNLTNDIEGSVEFKNVSLKYDDSGINALKNISFSLESGKSLAIIGTTGSGKSTIANLIMRLYDASEGEIAIDGTNIKDYQVQHIRNQMGYVPQDVFLFSDSIKNNIAFSDNSLPMEKIIEASKVADLHHNIEHFKEGYDTVLGERGITLSGGQKQRLSIARAIIKNPKILILDDALSAVDTKTEHNILSQLSKIMENRTSIIISHRVSSAQLADTILVLKNGEIIEEGTHNSLIDKQGAYHKLYQKQIKKGDMDD